MEATTPAALINGVLDMFRPKLHIVNVSRDEQVAGSEEVALGKSQYLEMFRDYPLEFYFLNTGDFFQAVDQFVKDHKIDVLLTIPKHQSNAISLFKVTHTKRLAYHSKIPILAAHE